MEKGIVGQARRYLQQAADAARELIYPRRCPVCDRPVHPAGALICPACEKTLQRVTPPVCLRCGKPVREPNTGHLCPDCLKIPHVYDRGCAVFVYHSVSGGLFRFKYEGRREYGAFYGKCMADRLRTFCAELDAAQGHRRSQGGPVGAAGQDSGSAAHRSGRMADMVSGGMDPRVFFDMLIPVPVSPRRLRQRGYNQALILAREVSIRTGIPVREDILYRISDTRPMKNMGPEERQNNLKKAFQCHGNDVELSSIMLIDDIYTTGATVDACARALYRQGAHRVCFLTLAIGDGGQETDQPGAGIVSG